MYIAADNASLNINTTNILKIGSMALFPAPHATEKRYQGMLGDGCLKSMITNAKSAVGLWLMNTLAKCLWLSIILTAIRAIQPQTI